MAFDEVASDPSVSGTITPRSHAPSERRLFVEQVLKTTDGSSEKQSCFASWRPELMSGLADQDVGDCTPKRPLEVFRPCFEALDFPS
jgi:hypothetical protein